MHKSCVWPQHCLLLGVASAEDQVCGENSRLSAVARTTASHLTRYRASLAFTYHQPHLFMLLHTLHLPSPLKMCSSLDPHSTARLLTLHVSLLRNLIETPSSGR